MRKRIRDGLIGTMIAGFCLVGAAAHSELAISAYGGKADTQDTDVELSLPGGTGLTCRNVSWADESFKGPMYYGLRLTYWLRKSPHWGFGGDFTHAKMVADLDGSLGETFSDLDFTHGYNLFTVNGSYRWFIGSESSGIQGSRWRPYAGLGVGVAVPHVEVTTAESRTDEYQVVGPAAQGLLGIDFSVSKRFSLFAEYKLSCADMEPEISSGGSLRLQPWTNHLVLGATISFR